jgi:hypothetical protein
LLAGGITFYVLVARHPQPAPIVGPTPTPAVSATACQVEQPAPRGAMGLAYDSMRHAVVMFGGAVGSQGLDSNETWTFGAGCWHLQRPAISPPARDLPVLAYDPVRKVTVLYGGVQHRSNQPGANQPEFPSDTWTWNGESWSQVAVGTGPSLLGAQGAFDLGHGVLVVFGHNGLTGLTETWLWDGNRWMRQAPAASPPDRFGGAMGYDPVSRRVLLYGGGTNSSPGTLGDTWLWDGTTWTQQAPASSPGPRLGAAMGSGQTLLLYSGDGNGMHGDTWLWTGTTWKQVNPAKNPGPRFEAGATGDGLNTWLFGGEIPGGGPANDLWHWDGSNWSQVP